jgi:hypothetical protein
LNFPKGKQRKGRRGNVQGALGGEAPPEFINDSVITAIFYEFHVISIRR